jgi:hypothetical protein
MGLTNRIESSAPVVFSGALGGPYSGVPFGSIPARSINASNLDLGKTLDKFIVHIDANTKIEVSSVVENRIDEFDMLVKGAVA